MAGGGGFWIRFFKHRLWDEADARRVLPPAALERLRQRVATSEAGHSGEIRICVEASLPLSYLWRRADARERAIAMFGKLRVWDTEQNNGVLIYLLLAEHRIEIVADRGLTQRVEAATWQQMLADMSAAFKRGEFEPGLADAVDRIGRLLGQHFPLAAGRANVNELPDSPALL
ncbi:TPM domain-containing protein [Roseateles sp. DAIF2]|uniref:TPM domain-containing protein n=1 Tax=Roseateles sp. DAIF2 TaxID=2714952 RepID=UPI0018A28001|nr:TPM domain-containing protein [Roseateles sp. DAIF2]QPF72022.1 TPM domain-containing protein [Roseateles sp. DAIF2]